ncbi:VWA domain-containing protein [Enterococcus dispar]|jgi:LPXTG-motif cell wall-anchored protein|uniref:VWFA domain-containing protein n=1 Tax=Enterococcus dispar ATCC 51266 TaxID=1139219 RepID=S1N9S8_9ENTE|nr:VWA domain-containing protein [Enterococcus dispar]EOT43943.1 hypothetical protein OMK_00085 [Enterococcus dispar ATCC 51266]EOW85800.1 hypothetical protein I569_01117 [Enterococcus dispar ATCC 51266]
MKEKVWRSKWSVFFSILIVLLPFAQFFVDGLTAIALTNNGESNIQQLFDNEYGKASLSYQTKENKIIWQMNVDKKAAEKATRFLFSLKDKKNKSILPTLSEENQATDLFTVISKETEKDYAAVFEREPSNTNKNYKIEFSTPLVSALTFKVAFDAASDQTNEQKTLFTKEYPISIKENDRTQASTEETMTSATKESNDASSTEISSTSEESTSEVKNLGDADEATVDSAKKEAEKKYDETGVPQKITRSAAVSSKSLKTKTYANIPPVYINENGTYPKSYWETIKNGNVRNHPGNIDGSSNWRENGSNKYNSFIEYGGTGDNSDFAISKYAEETSQGLFDVYLNIRGNVQKEITPIDIMLVVDWSGSMNENNRLGEVKSGISQFINTLDNSGISDKINIGYVGYSSPGYLNKTIDLQSFNKVKQQIKEFTPTKSSGGTFTEKALRDAQNQLEKENPEHKKIIVLLTDGVPTFSYNPIKVNEIKNAQNTSLDGEKYFATQVDSTKTIGRGNTSSLYGYGAWGENYPKAILGNTGRIVDVENSFVSTIGQAIQIKEKNTEIHALGIQLQSDSGARLSYDDVQDRMEQIATKSDSGVLYYETANKASEIANYLSNKAVQIISTVSGGKVRDPIGDQFNYVDSSLEINSVGKTPTSEINYSDPVDKVISINNLNLGKGQEIQIHYKVRMNTEDENFVPSKWYPINGKTTFAPNQELPDNIVDFGVPSAKAPGVDLSLKKNWVEFDGNPSDRKNLYFSVGRKTKNSQGNDIGYVKLSGNNNKQVWERANISQISSTADDSSYKETIWLPKFNNSGEDFNYFFSKEINSPENYVPKDISENGDGTEWENVKEFKKLKIQITKIDADNKEIIDKEASFKLSGGDLKGPISFAYNGKGMYTLPDDVLLDKGQTYFLTEISAPEGYQKLAAPLEIKIAEDGAITISENLGFTVKDNNLVFNVPNKPKVPLPATGGSGVWLIYGAGITALIVGVGYYFLRNKSKGEA